MSEQSTALQWSVTTGGAYVCGPYLIAERVDDRGWNASKSNETLVLADTLERCKKACETDAATPHPEALRLADALDVGEISYTGMCKAAAELRRLHELNKELLEALKMVMPTLERLKFEADGSYGKNFSVTRAETACRNYVAARAAIAKAEGKV